MQPALGKMVALNGALAQNKIKANAKNTTFLESIKETKILAINM